ncbi:MAG: DUF177 domain-containing protein [Candidatus Gastranaerophilales bacterium]|nr:DUF177 domain-containing protein [Candidatus Gastranaerophilales bacterium]
MKIKVSDIENSESKIQTIVFSEIIPEINNEIPVNAKLTVSLLGSLVKLEGTITAVQNLTCDICLKEFTKDISLNVKEFYEKDSLNPLNSNDFEIKENSFFEDLNGSDEIDITNFIYQCIILSMPNKIVCDINCNGNEKLNEYIKKDFSDPRLEIFKNIKIEKE